MNRIAQYYPYNARVMSNLPSTDIVVHPKWHGIIVLVLYDSIACVTTCTKTCKYKMCFSQVLLPHVATLQRCDVSEQPIDNTNNWYML
jgi:hypothetical protein